MREYLVFSLSVVWKFLIPAISFLFTVIIFLLIRKILFRRLTDWAKKTNSDLDDIFIASLRLPFLIWALMLGTYLTLRISNLPEAVVLVLGKLLIILGIFSVTWVLASISVRIIFSFSRRSKIELPVTSLTQNIVRLSIFIIGALILLNTLGISITPILTTLGIGGLAVALALQDTLSNLFAGFYITLARQIRIGDFIKLESGEEGYVLDIGWRATRVRMLPNNLVLIPNNKLAQSLITNYSLPDKELAVLVQVGVHYDSDLKYVEKVTLEVAKEVMREVPGGVPEFQPFIRYHTFGDFSINFTVILRAREYVDNYLIKHELIKRLHERYKKEGIVIPYPIRALNFEQEKGQR